MNLKALVIVFSVFAGVAALALLVASAAVGVIESNSEERVRSKLLLDGLEWTAVAVDGLEITLSGTAPNEAARFRALSAAGEVVDAYRLIDTMQIEASAVLEAPEFSVEILRNGESISLIGLIPFATDREQVVETLREFGQGARVADMLESADHLPPPGWDLALSYAIEALAVLEHSKISVHPALVVIEANSSSAAARSRLEDRLSSSIPPGLEVILDISAPREVVSPFTLRYLLEDGTGHFDACFADTESSRIRILAAAQQAGLIGDSDCAIALGNPSPRWAEAVSMSLAALAEIGAGSVTFSDADVTLVAAEDTVPALFERVAAELEADLPPVFALHAMLPDPVTIDGTGENEGTPEFLATLSPEGLVQLRGRVTTERARAAVESYAGARFGLDRVYAATRIDPDLPEGWPLRTLAGIEALAFLSNGSVVIQPEFVEVRGVTGSESASADIARLLSEKLGEAENYSIEVEYHETLDPVALLPTPEECASAVNEVLSETKIAFAPGSSTIAPGAGDTLRSIATILQDCSEVKMEIGGHTDSQGRESMNERLSQGRADAVLNALMARRVLTANLSAKGYGESVPISDNETEEGREANRRIEFTLVGDQQTPDGSGETTPDNEATTVDPAPEEADSDPEVMTEEQPASETDPQTTEAENEQN